MPFSNYDQFDSVLLAKMTAAYDEVCSRLHIDGNNELSGKLAAIIADLASEGFSEVNELRDAALERMARKKA